MQDGRWKPSWLVAALATGCIAGLLGARFSMQREVILFLMLSSAIVSIGSLRKGVICIALVAGVVVGGVRAQPFITSIDTFSDSAGQVAVIEGVIKTDPVYGYRGMRDFTVEAKQLNGNTISGTVKVSGFIDDVRRGDTITAKAKLRDAFGSRQGYMSFAEITVIERNDSQLFSLRSKFIAHVYSLLPENEAALGLGFLLGVRSLLPEQLESDLSTTGLTHIVAVSGYNLTILVATTRRIFAAHSRLLSVAVSGALLIGFLVLVGDSPSIVRASIVSFVSLAGWYFGRQTNGLQILILSAAISALYRPYFLWTDLGWHLSFLAFFGVLIVAPLIKQDRDMGLIKQIILETTCAQIMTAPLILLIFETVSPISIAANVLVLPFIPIAMLLVAIVGGLMFLNVSLAAWISVFALMVLGYITEIVQLLASVSWSTQSYTISSGQFAGLMAITVVLTYILYRKATIDAATPPKLYYD